MPPDPAMSAERLSKIVEKAASEIYIFDPESFRFLLVNEVARKTLGYTQEELTELHPWDLKPGFSEERFRNFVRPLQLGDLELLTFETVHSRKDGSQYSVSVRLQYIENGDGPVFYAAIKNISEQIQDRRKTKSALRTSNRIFRQAEKVAKIGSWEYDIEADTLRWSDETYAISGMSPGDPISIESAIAMYIPEDRPVIEASLGRLLSEHGTVNVEASILAADGELKRVHVMGEYLERDSESSPRIVGTFRDITESFEARLALRIAADYDPLTNLYNRSAFDRALTARIAARLNKGDDFFVVLFDLDGFKHINDTFGHVVGDAVLQKIGARIERVILSQAIASRWGGDEFAIISPLGFSPAQASELGEKLIEIISEPMEIDGNFVGVSATCGIARAGEIPDPQDLMRRADLALYHGKTREPGRVHFYKAELERPRKERRRAMTLVRSALAEHRIEVGYQPIVNLGTKSIIGIEALMRLRSKNGSRMNAEEVLPAIRDPVLSREISERMLHLSFREFDQLANAQPSMKFLSFNATEADLLNRDFVDRLVESLEEFSIDPKGLTLEITETMLMVGDNNSVRNVLQELQRVGVQIALDDFGTGFSSLSHLRDFPIDKVKIDRSFVSQVCENDQSVKIVEALIVMARNLDIEAIAEGIETEDQRQCLLNIGCNYGQGYLFSRAVSAREIANLKIGVAPVSNV